MRTFCIYGILIYLAAINIAAFFLYGIDKWKARHDKWRITEARLLWIAVAGGSIGALLGMKIWHHETKHNKFRFGLPAILFLHLAAVLAAHGQLGGYAYGQEIKKRLLHIEQP